MMRYRWSKNKDGELVKSAIIYTKDEHKISVKDVDPLAVYICEKLNKEGFETYIVGGAVRDFLLNKTPKDFDIASAASPSKIKRLFNNSRVIGKRFRLVHIFFGSKIFEVATFRSLEDGADPNTFGCIEDDAKRRDFTMNALFYDPQKELVLDYVGGFKDIQEKRLRPVIPVKRIFEEDPVRMIRAVKYSVLAGFGIPFFLRRKIKESAHLLKIISPSRLTEELTKILKSPMAADVIEELYLLRLYEYLQPKAAKLIGESLSFRNRYFNSLSGISSGASAGESAVFVNGLAALVRDYINDNTDWANADQTKYKDVFLLGRKFILPMNPPRFELSKAIRNIFEEHGIKVKIWRKTGRL